MITHKNPAAVALGRRGGKARAAAMSPARRKEVSLCASTARWASVERCVCGLMAAKHAKRLKHVCASVEPLPHPADQAE